MMVTRCVPLQAAPDYLAHGFPTAGGYLAGRCPYRVINANAAQGGRHASV
jgi:hypothetical protein